MKKNDLLASSHRIRNIFHLNKNFKKRNATLFISIFLIYISIYSQVETNSNPTDQEDPKITTSGISYGHKLTPGQHSQFTIDYKVNSNLFLQVRGDLKIYGLVEVFKVPILSKRYISDKSYLFSGAEVELTRDFLGAAQFDSQFKLINGFGYDVNQHFTIEAKQDFNFSEGNLGPFANPNMFSVKGKFKF